MLENIDMTKDMSKKEYKVIMDALEPRLADLQQELLAKKLPVMIVFEGWSAAGKGTLISKVLHPLDPRHFNVYTMDKLTDAELFRPALWSYWVKSPAKGQIALFDKSWHRVALPSGVAKWKLSAKERDGFFYDVNAFEQQLTDDGTLIIKFFLHISKDEQKKRFQELERNDDTKWRVDDDDRKQNDDYNENLELFERMIQESNSGKTKWVIVEANDKHYAAVKVYETIISKVEEELVRREAKAAAPKPEPPSIQPQEISILRSIDLDKTISSNEYKDKLKYYQNKMATLGFKLYTKRRPVVIVYEGWDAAGKGGNIKRLTQELDPRGYDVNPVAAPTAEELAHHYLWRFWNRMPKGGHLGIFDRSWYGRVMVERIEGFCSLEEWQRAFQEINDMEKHMVNHGAIVFKFWLHIDQEEQLRRFNDRQENPAKQYKITEEDWRNREKWDAYERAVDEMLFRTNTAYAPWTVVESNDKKYARIKVLEHVTDVLEKKLK